MFKETRYRNYFSSMILKKYHSINCTLQDQRLDITVIVLWNEELWLCGCTEAAISLDYEEKTINI